MTLIYQPKFERSATLMRHLTKASDTRTWIEQQTLDVSWIAPAQRDTLIRLAHYSTKIEGNPLTLPEVEALARGKNLMVEEKAKREILNYFATLRWIWKNTASKEILEKDLLYLHKLLTQEVLPKNESGFYKTKPNVVYGNGRVIYKPPPPEAAPLLTRSLLKWINSKAAYKEHAAIVAAIAHHQLASIHPFSDGNGRAARCLEIWILYQRGFDTNHIFALDEFLDNDRARYYREIQAVRDRENNLTSWLEYIAEGILETLSKTQIRIQTLKAKKTSQKIILNINQERILQILAQAPRMGGGELNRALGITRSHLNKLIHPLLSAGLITKEGSTKAATYRLS